MLQLFSEHCLMDHGDEIQIGPARVEVRGGLITEVVAGSRSEVMPTAAVGVIDLGSALLGPALVNSHTHLAMSALRGVGGAEARKGNIVEDLWFGIEARLTAADVRAFARMGAMDCLLSGSATVWDHYYGGRAVADALVDVGLCGVVAPTLQDLGGPGIPRRDAQLRATAGMAEDAALAARGVHAAVGPHATDTVGDRLWRDALALADRHALPVHVHAAQSMEEVERVAQRWGCTPVQRLAEVGALDGGPVLLVHGLLVSEEDRARLDPARHVLGHCPYSQAQYAFPADVAAWRRHGVRVAVGTDAGACNDTMDVAAELRGLASGWAYGLAAGEAVMGLRNGVDPGGAQRVREARAEASAPVETLQDPGVLWKMVTSNPGAIHPAAPTGRVVRGARADLAVWDLDHPALWPATDPLRALAFGGSSAALMGLMANGVWRLRPGQSRRELVDSDAWTGFRREAAERLAALTA